MKIKYSNQNNQNGQTHKLNITSKSTSKYCYSTAKTVYASFINKAVKSNESLSVKVVTTSTDTNSTITKDTMTTTNTTATSTVINTIKQYIYNNAIIYI